MSKDDIYNKEYNILTKYRSLIGTKEKSPNEVLKHLKGLADYYEDILAQIKFITKISDRLQKKLSLEKEKSDRLLLNILPKKNASDLKENRRAEPRIYQTVTKYFSDIVGFTKISTRIYTKLLIDELNEMFTLFDMIMKKNGCEQIKIFGDAYFAICGVPKQKEELEKSLKEWQGKTDQIDDILVMGVKV